MKYGTRETSGHNNAGLSDEDRDRLRFVLEQAVNTDGGHHKQWYLEAIAGRLLIDLPDHEPGIAP